MISHYRYLVITIGAFLLLQNPSSAKQGKMLDSTLRALSARSSDAGFSICVIKKDSIIYSGAFGYRNLEKRLPVTENTVFPIGSCTKAFTAALTGCLQPQVLPDKAAHYYLPQLQFYNAQMTEQVTVRDLLCHRSGLPRHEFSWFLMASPGRDSMLQRIAFLEPNYRVAEKWQYNNFGYFILGMIAEKVTGASYEKAIEQYLLAPLQMKHSYFSYDLLLADSNAAHGYKKINNLFKPVPYHPLLAMAPAGGLNSTAPDMARWLSTWVMNNGNIIPKGFVTQSITSQVVTKPALPNNDQPGSYFSNYGFGWFLTSYRGHYRVEHGGNIDGFTTTACFFPSDSIGIVVLCNRENSLLPAMVRNLLSDHFLNIHDNQPEPPKPAAPPTNETPKDKLPRNNSEALPVIPPTHPLLAYTGRYENPGYGVITVFLRNDSLMAALGNYEWWLRPEQYDAFMGIDPGGDIKLSVLFKTHAAGYIESMVIPFEPTVAPIRFIKQQDKLPLSGSIN
ncbi:MAG: serine hydrolase [Chitinophagaceae bacterium]